MKQRAQDTHRFHNFSEEIEASPLRPTNESIKLVKSLKAREVISQA
jgi:hypothetical protein